MDKFWWGNDEIVVFLLIFSLQFFDKRLSLLSFSTKRLTKINLIFEYLTKEEKPLSKTHC